MGGAQERGNNLRNNWRIFSVSPSRGIAKLFNDRRRTGIIYREMRRRKQKQKKKKKEK
jgi:hypothetical protein